MSKCYYYRKSAKTLAMSLPLLDSLDDDMNDIKIKPTYFVGSEGALHISAEDGLYFVDYYGEYRGGDPYIDPALITWAKKNDGHWDWDSPGSICFYQ